MKQVDNGPELMGDLITEFVERDTSLVKNVDRVFFFCFNNEHGE